MVLEGYIEKIIYKNDENGYVVFTVETTGGEEVFVGNAPHISEGLFISATGDYVHHPQYDLQFKMTECEISLPEDVLGIERYLASGIVKGIGEVTAKRIVKKFGTDTLRIMEEEPERLAEIKGISMQKARKIAASYAENRDFQQVIIFLSQYGISVNLAMKIFNEYGDGVYSIITSNPYKIAEDIQGVGFKTADDIARMAGIPEDSEFRIRSAILYALNQGMANGHMYLPVEELMQNLSELISFTDESTFQIVEEQLSVLQADRSIKFENIGEECTAVYSLYNYYVEKNSASMLAELRFDNVIYDKEFEESIKRVERDQGITFDESQRNAIRNAITGGVAVITGGPGTGKTTITKAIIEYYIYNGKDVKLAAPTGRAAKRITEATGYKAATVHRLLEFAGEPGERDDHHLKFGRNKENPIEADVVIVDEASMLDSMLFYSLLSAIKKGTNLVLIGDTDQLPPVGAGNVLRDIIDSKCFPVTELEVIFRQSAESRIIENAHNIRMGRHIAIDNKNSDFFFIPRKTPTEIINEVNTLITKNLPDYLKLDPLDIQVLTPMRKNELGVENLNKKLQQALNSPSKSKKEKVKNDIIFREGDRVMQIRNNYRIEWTIYNGDDIEEEGIGVFNGDTGVISSIDEIDEELWVTFDDRRLVKYSFSMLDEIEHAFAVTVHKSQGSEYPAVILPLYNGNPKLLNRNLLYTAITRAKRMVVVVGNLGLLNQMIDNVTIQGRYTGFVRRLRECFEFEEFKGEDV
ncbi:MAG: ATP-dependent RecD-like DNA helicase [Eubacterium sp.]|nr:ATP-dependent RecD-like DNA helicase [Eubacterium sp.]